MTTPTTPAEMAEEVKRLALAVRIAITRQCFSPTAANVARCDEADAALGAAIDRLAALAAIQVEPQEPVAWRWQPSEVFADWVTTCDKARAEHAAAHVNVQPLYATQCKGMNCPVTLPDQEHSLECQAEHAASIAGGTFTKAGAAQPEPTVLEAAFSEIVGKPVVLPSEPQAAPAGVTAKRETLMKRLKSLRVVLGIDSPETRGWAPAVQREARRVVDGTIAALAAPAQAQADDLDVAKAMVRGAGYSLVTQRFIINFAEFIQDWRKGDFDLPTLAALDVQSCFEAWQEEKNQAEVAFDVDAAAPAQAQAEALRFARETLDEARTYCEGPDWSPSMAAQCWKAIARIDRALAALASQEPKA